ncbi:MAG TPA: hypothetical protein VMT03_06740 [Polyangia bacterium]|nr:hypothetical protein [Polyangia bacterium]
MKTTCALLTFLALTAMGLGARAEEPAKAPSMLSLKTVWSNDVTAAFTTSGVGLYPFNFSLALRRGALTPYGSAGAAASVVRLASTAPESNGRLLGAIVQPRVAVGARYLPVRGLALSAEVDVSPCAIGLVTFASGQGGPGGVGSVFGLSVGAEWL